MKDIPKRVSEIVKKYNTRDPYKLAEFLGIKVKLKPYSDNTKGYYINIKRNKFTVINSNLTEDKKRIVLAHEIGHAVLHSYKEVHFIKENTLFPSGRYEFEANTFAAEFLIDEKELDKHVFDEMTITQLACFYGVPTKLVEYKFNK